MTERVAAMGLQERVTVLNRLVDVNQVLAKVHASVVLADAPDIVKAYPHSLIESLAAGKPVIVSRAIPMAAYVEEKGCGVVVEDVTSQEVLAMVETLGREYGQLQDSARTWGKRDFSMEGKIASFERVYEEILLNERKGRIP